LVNKVACIMYVTFGLWHEPSVCRRSVTLVHATQVGGGVELCGNIMHHLKPKDTET